MSTRVRPSFSIALFLLLPLLFIFPSDQVPGKAGDEPLPGFVRLPPGELKKSLIAKTDPILPPLPSSEKINRTAILELIIDREGVVRGVKPVSVHLRLEEAAMRAARKWKFSPVVQNGAPVMAIGDIDMDFVQPVSLAESAELDNARNAAKRDPKDSQVHYRLAKICEEAGRYEEAIESLNQALSLKPDFEAAEIALGGIYGHLRQGNRQVSAYRQYLSQNPKSVEVLKRLSEAFMADKRYSDAIKPLEELEVLIPLDPWVPHEMGRANSQLGRMESAIRFYRMALDVDAENASLHDDLGYELTKIREFKDAEAQLTRALALDPALRSAYHHLGDLYLRANRPWEAIPVFENCIRRAHPDFDDLAIDYRMLGICRIYAKEFEPAVKFLEQSLVLNPNQAQVFCDLGRIQIVKNQKEHAVELLRQGIRINANEPCLLSQLSYALTMLNRLSEAENAAESLVRLFPEALPAYLQLAQVLIRKESWEKADATLKRASQVAPGDFRIHVLAAELFDKTAKTAEAEREIREAMKLQPNDPTVLNNLGYFLADHDKDLAEALKLIERAVKASPDNAAFLDSLGWVYFKLGRNDEAEKYLLEALKITSDSAAMLEHLGDLYQKQGKEELARQKWQESLLVTGSATDIDRLKRKLGEQK